MLRHLYPYTYTSINRYPCRPIGLTEARRSTAEAIAVYPCIIKILPQHIFNKKDPIVFGVEVVEGVLKVGTPLYIPSIGLVR